MADYEEAYQLLVREGLIESDDIPRLREQSDQEGVSPLHLLMKDRETVQSASAGSESGTLLPAQTEATLGLDASLLSNGPEEYRGGDGFLSWLGSYNPISSRGG